MKKNEIQLVFSNDNHVDHRREMEQPKFHTRYISFLEPRPINHQIYMQSILDNLNWLRYFYKRRGEKHLPPSRFMRESR